MVECFSQFAIHSDASKSLLLLLEVTLKGILSYKNVVCLCFLSIQSHMPATYLVRIFSIFEEIVGSLWTVDCIYWWVNFIICKEETGMLTDHPIAFQCTQRTVYCLRIHWFLFIRCYISKYDEQRILPSIRATAMAQPVALFLPAALCQAAAPKVGTWLIPPREHQ